MSTALKVRIIILAILFAGIALAIFIFRDQLFLQEGGSDTPSISSFVSSVTDTENTEETSDTSHASGRESAVTELSSNSSSVESKSSLSQSESNSSEASGSEGSSTEKDEIWDEEKSKAYQEDLLELINVEREKKGLATFELYERLSGFAAIRAGELVTNASNTRPDGSSFSSILDENQYPYASVNEIHAIADLRYEASDIVDSWFASETSKAVFLSENFDGIGIGLHEEVGMLYLDILLLEDQETNEEALSSYSDAQIVEYIFKYINYYRGQRGLSALEYSRVLEDGAIVRVSELQNRFDYWRQDGNAWSTIFQDLNINPWAYAEGRFFIENLSQTPGELVGSWMNQEESRNIVNANFQNIGIAISENHGGIYISILYTN